MFVKHQLIGLYNRDGVGLFAVQTESFNII
jgi:hypothetical protein